MLSLKGTAKMTNVEQIRTRDFGESAMSSAKTLTSSIQTIATAHMDYAKKAMQDGSEFISKCLSGNILNHRNHL